MRICLLFGNVYRERESVREDLDNWGILGGAAKWSFPGRANAGTVQMHPLLRALYLGQKIQRCIGKLWLCHICKPREHLNILLAVFPGMQCHACVSSCWLELHAELSWGTSCTRWVTFCGNVHHSGVPLKEQSWTNVRNPIVCLWQSFDVLEWVSAVYKGGLGPEWGVWCCLEYLFAPMADRLCGVLGHWL